MLLWKMAFFSKMWIKYQFLLEYIFKKYIHRMCPNFDWVNRQQQLTEFSFLCEKSLLRHSSFQYMTWSTRWPFGQNAAILPGTDASGLTEAGIAVASCTELLFSSCNDSRQVKNKQRPVHHEITPHANIPDMCKLRPVGQKQCDWIT